MANESKSSKLSSKEAAELQRLQEEEEVARIAVIAAEEAKRQVVHLETVKEEAATPKPRGGDVMVMCLRDNNAVRLGHRAYVFKRGQQIPMDPGHAEEMRHGGWVTPA